MDSNVEPFDVERFKEDFGSLFSVFGRIEGWLGLCASFLKKYIYMSEKKKKMRYQEEIMVFRLGSEILEDRLLPVTLHMVPIVDHAMSDRIVYAVSRSFGVG